MNLNYDLAVQLKKAGWKQDYSNGLSGFVFENDDPDSNIAYSPTLSDLIKECGAGFFKLIHQEHDKWYAGDETNKVYGYGATPKEAVANLYLALHPIEPEV